MTQFKRHHYISLLVSVSLLASMSTSAAAESTSPMVTSTSASSAQTCLKPLFEKRETTIMNAWETEYAEVKQSMEARKTSISGALEMTDVKQARKAISVAHKNFNDWVKKARATSRENRRLAWEAFKTDASSCGKRAVTSLESASSNSSTTDVKAE